ncbi:MAG TPA: AraC family transcriptional regulator [Hungateiclostridium thermocellum]|jgi:predicted transcriptional regulator|uniref:DRTGG domain protein n=2 Tax=Acetivibrio thermocellus TaxID=1515 RepID=A3DC95_ACET2|nr:DRTGG domain-containing protein [Acetivibrio thermocellus]CDG35014.1 DRTGG domain-containing protein [Acetivibrio thermocellus BC1]ABN51574.1 DRTGG domain protein [Acetivibrio thermocellus ATCC 27405]ADU74939.1 DRTGG domain protein [Acetivibrio thermocellus DSM 1313]ALX08899.1 DRTGG domain protein [Acetivibrio thermocellus AD2]ANV76649.1 DRTGG domain protein [Acetivibrio thermocellus DSM 2360]
MKVKEFAEQLKMEILTGEKGLEKEIKGMYICDLLSWVMSHAAKGDAWITVHTHVNIVAVALMADIPCIIIPEGIEVEEATIKKAVEEDIAILRTSKTAYQIACEAGKLL